MEALKGSKKTQRRVEENRVPEPLLWLDSEMFPTGSRADSWPPAGGVRFWGRFWKLWEVGAFLMEVGDWGGL